MKKNNLKMPALKMKIWALVMAAVITGMLLAGVLVPGSEWTTLHVQAEEMHPARVVDEADILYDYEEEELTEQVDEISERQQFDVVVVTVNSLDGEDIQYYAADYYDYNGYGMGDNYDGAMFIISMEEREWFVLTTGWGMDVLTDNEIDYMAEEMVPYLSDGDYMRAFEMYANFCDKQVAYENGEDIATDGEAVTGDESTKDDENLTGEDDFYEDLTGDSSTEEDYIIYEEESSPGIIVSVIIGLVLAFIPVLVMRGKLKSVHMQSSAGGYEKSGSRNITVRQDRFLYHTVNRVPRPKENSNRSGGGSSIGGGTFRGSSGRSHGGRGGGF